MAIVKIISHGKSNAATKQILSYVLNPNKTTEEICGTIGDYTMDSLTPKSVFQDFQRIKSLFGKQAGGRTYTHGTVSFPPEEKITYEQAADFAREYLPQIFPGHQILFATHTDTDHVHFHFVVNPVSYLDGSMLHWKKYDLQRAKELCNAMCQELGLSVAKKRHHADGTAFAPGEITAWSKDKYHALLSDPKKSYIIDAALAIQSCIPKVSSREEFCVMMENEFGWRVAWEDTKKHITFIDTDGHRVRGSNLSKTFNMDISKEGLQNAIGRNRSTAQTHAPGASECTTGEAIYNQSAPTGKRAADGTVEFYEEAARNTKPAEYPENQRPRGR